MNLVRDLINQATATNFRANCPYCGGNNSLSVNKVDGEYKYKCFKANCNIAGNYATGYTVAELKAKLSKTVIDKPFQLPDYCIRGIANDSSYEYLRNHFCLDSVVRGKAKVAYDPKENRLLFLVYDGSVLKGAVGRALSRRTMPKSKIYPGSVTYPFICGSEDTLVIVEDCASACAVTRLPVTGMALLGTYLKPEYIPVISRYKNVIIALDNDANAKSLTINKLIKYYTKSSVQMIPKDIKNMTEEELCQSLNLKLNDGSLVS